MRLFFIPLLFVFASVSQAIADVPSPSHLLRLPEGVEPIRFASGTLTLKQNRNGNITRKELATEFALNTKQWARGFMYRKELPENQAMLFVFPADRVQSFWMKNTYVSLDMIFADKTGKIVSIAPNATPLSELSVSSKVPARVVLEINAGLAKKWNILVGDQLEHPGFSHLK